MFDKLLKGLKDHDGLEYSDWSKGKRILFQISVVLFIIMLGFIIFDNDENSKSPNKITNSFDIPTNLINKTLYTNPYLCRNTLFINENYEFERVIHSIGNLSTSDKMVIRGKFLPNGEIIFYSENEWYFRGYIKETYMEDTWVLEKRYEGITLSDYSYQNTGNRYSTGYSSSDKTYSIEECVSGY